MSTAYRFLTADDLARAQAENPHARLELLEGSISESEAPLFAHGDAQTWLAAWLKPKFHRRGGRDDGTGGWWIASEVDIQLAPGTIVRPDVAGWRRDRHSHPPTNDWPVREIPDWVSEVVSPGSFRRDQFEKRRLYWEAGIEWYWLVHLGGPFIDVLRHTPDGYVTVNSVAPTPNVRLPPFDAISFDTRPVFGIEPEDE
jgi:Uma2 family endonuclease